MDGPTAYDDDIYAWSQEQAAVLRRLAATRRDLPNELDLEHVAEEIEDVGKTEIRTVESFIQQLLIHLLKIASVPKATPVRHWRGEIEIQHAALVKEYRRSMRQVVDLDAEWRAAVARADAALDQHGDSLLPGLPGTCPFVLDALVSREFDPEQALDRLASYARAVPN